MSPNSTRLVRGWQWPLLVRRGLQRCGSLLLALLAAPAQADAALPPSCQARVLEALGWQLKPAPVPQLQIEAGQPCTRSSAQEARSAGDLRAWLPQDMPAAEHQQMLQQLLDHPATHCAFSFKLGQAARTATDRLQANRGYRFSALQLGWIGFGFRGADAQGWQRFRSFGRGYQPGQANARAMDAFYRGSVRSECGVGRQVAQLATLRELFGDEAFDQHFSPGELSIGTFLTLHGTDSILLGRHAGELFADGKAVKTSQRGRQAFMAAPGFIEHVFDARYLDDIHNQAENFVVVDVSAAAAESLARHGGFAHFDAQNRRIWELAQPLQDDGWRRFERLLHERDPALRATLSSPQQQALQQIDALLDDPFYRGFMIYVHPMGVKPVGYHIARLLDRNPRTPYAIELALHNLHGVIYQRWLESQLRACSSASPQANPSVDATTR